MTRRFLAASLGGMLVLMLLRGGAGAVVTGSPHDFSASGPWTQSGTLAGGGVCSACHVSHKADPFRIWPRDLGGYRTALVNNGVSSIVNYVPDPSIQCYDCHDYHSGGGINNEPALSLFRTDHRPQDIAFGFRKTGLGSMTEDAPGSSGTVSGYYENRPAYSSSYGADPGINPTAPPYPADNAALLRTGGHYFKRKDPTGTVNDAFDIGDKLPCRNCHDPHVWNASWQAFIKPNLGGSLGWSRVFPSGQPTASTFMANEFTSISARSDAYSRTLCIACHGDSDTLLPVNFTDVSPEYSASAGTIVRPPNVIVEHRNASQVACVSCHNHNAVDASCGDCHGNPPPGYPGGNTPTAYAPASDSHGRHTAAYEWGCFVCHFGNNHGDNTVQVAFDNETVGGRNQLGSDSNTAVPPGGTTCSNIYCHSSGRAGITPSAAPGHYRQNVPWGTGMRSCDSCHGAFSPGDFTADNASRRYGAPNYANAGTPGSDNANSHRAHVGTYECFVCHDGTVTNVAWPTLVSVDCTALHVNGRRDIAFAGPASGGSYDNVQRSCSVANCHGPGTPRWGETIAECGACHLGTGDMEDYAFGAPYVKSVVDNNEWATRGHGIPTGSTNPGSGKPGAGLVCTRCHDFGVPHDNAVNPFRIRTSIDNGSGPVPVTPSQPDSICRACHAQGLVRNHSAADMQASGYGTLRTWTWTPRCVDCHDPHGDSSSWMLRDAINHAAGQGTYGTASASTFPVPNRPIASRTQLDPSTARSAGVCDSCHVSTIHNGSADDPNPEPGHKEGTDCIGCHSHDGGFRPSGCEGCHGYPPYDPGGGNPAAPNVVATPDNSFSYWTQSGHGRWANDNLTPAAYRPGCEACHDIGTPSGTHQDNQASAVTTNTFHLKATINGVPTLPAASNPDGTQAIFDNFCWLACHQPRNIKNHRHARGTDNMVLFGRSNTYADPSGRTYPGSTNPSADDYGKPAGGALFLDSGLTSYAPPGGNVYGPCVGCHDPHGTQAQDVDQSTGTNVMMRGNWDRTKIFCQVCHR